MVANEHTAWQCAPTLP